MLLFYLALTLHIIELHQGRFSMLSFSKYFLISALESSKFLLLSDKSESAKAIFCSKEVCLCSKLQSRVCWGERRFSSGGDGVGIGWGKVACNRIRHQKLCSKAQAQFSVPVLLCAPLLYPVYILPICLLCT